MEEQHKERKASYKYSFRLDEQQNIRFCRMVLPRDKAVPLILDDALANFDDQRLAAALDWLLEESRSRQILLFTCHRREGDYLRDRAHVISLN